MLGEGDGRFLERFLDQNPDATLDYVDSSAGMLSLARPRAGVHQARVSFHHADVLAWTPLRDNYDLIVTHFFLDCFSQHDLAILIRAIAGHASQAKWIVSDFRQPRRGLAAVRAACWHHWTQDPRPSRSSNHPGREWLPARTRHRVGSGFADIRIVDEV